MSVRMTQEEVGAYYARQDAAGSKPERSRAGVEREAKLHQQILDECRRRGWIVFHGSMAHQTYRTAGEPDFVIAAADGRMLMVEAKTRAGKLSMEQAALRALAKKLGHTIHLVRSLEDFLSVARNTAVGT